MTAAQRMEAYLRSVQGPGIAKVSLSPRQLSKRRAAGVLSQIFAASGMSERQFAGALGISQTSLRDKLSGSRSVTLEDIYQLDDTQIEAFFSDLVAWMHERRRNSTGTDG